MFGTTLGLNRRSCLVLWRMQEESVGAHLARESS